MYKFLQNISKKTLNNYRKCTRKKKSVVIIRSTNHISWRQQKIFCINNFQLSKDKTKDQVRKNDLNQIFTKNSTKTPVRKARTY